MATLASFLPPRVVAVNGEPFKPEHFLIVREVVDSEKEVEPASKSSSRAGDIEKDQATGGDFRATPIYTIKVSQRH